MSDFNIEYLFVCLVEPSHVQAKFISHYLNVLGIQRIECFHEGKHALQWMSHASPDVVISSLYLPDMTGTELVYHMREDDRLSDVPFILVSSETNPRYLDPIRQAGAIAILPKPVQSKQLNRALLATLDFVNPDALRLNSDHVEVETLKVLVVDDSLTARNYITSVLRNIGIEELYEAVNGREAVQFIESMYFDLIFTDYNMPEMNGKELIEYIRFQSHQTAVPVFMISSETDQGRLAAVQQAGVSAICDKPLEPIILKKLIESALAIDTD